MLEPLSYSLVADKKLTSTEKRYVVTETARRLTVPGVDVLKAEFPLELAADPLESEWARACQEISSASRAPWILLSAAVDYRHLPAPGQSGLPGGRLRMRSRAGRLAGGRRADRSGAHDPS